MTKRLMALVLVGTTVLLTLAACSADLKEGTQVCAQWTNGGWYLGTITGKSGDKFSIDYADGDKGTVTRDQIMLIPAKPGLKAGDRVFAVWTTAMFYNGIVDSVQDGGVVVKWDDGSAPSLVPFGKVIPVGKAIGAGTTAPATTMAPAANGVPGVVPAAADVKPGLVVCAQWHSAWYLATVSGPAAADGKFPVDYADGDKGNLEPSQMRLIPAKPELAVGDKVFAVWTSKQFYPGTVGELKNDGAVVKWDDGDTPILVPFGQIIKF